MAYIRISEDEGRWLDYEERAQYLEELHEEKRLLVRLLKAGKAAEQDLTRMEWLLDEIERVERVHKGERDVRYFGVTYFSEDANPDNADNLIPTGVSYENVVDFHKQLCGLFDDIVEGIQTRHVAWACPRRHAKTAWISNIFLLHQVVYRLRKYIVLFSETTDVAGDFITWGRYQLKLNEKLRSDFGELLHVKPSMNNVDNKYEYITSSNTKVEAKGLGTQTRGLRHGASRPDLFILDDLESDDSTNTPDLIDKSKRWFREEMLQALSKEGICVYLGTILCFGSLLHHVIEERKDFESRKFSAIKNYADREDLWKEWREIRMEDDKEAVKRADQFYRENKEEMLKGTEILWDGYWSYYDLIKIREDDGIKAFNQEYQNNPTDEERQIFKPEHFVKFNESDLEGKELKFYGAIDIAMGKEKGDYSVIVTIAKNVNTGICYVYDVFMERCHPNRLIEKATEYTLKYQYEYLAVEAQFAQEFIADQLSERLQAVGYPALTRIRQIKQRTRKELRIEALLPEIQSAKLRFNATLDTVMMEQFEMYPMHAHDDFPDAVSMAYSTAQGGSVTVKTARKRTR